MTFLTLEDINSINFNHINKFHEIDTSKISLEEFSNVQYDFCIVSHTISGSEHTFEFAVFNDLWSLMYHVADKNNHIFQYFDADISLNDNIITIVTSENSIKLRLLMSSYYKEEGMKRTVYVPTNSVINVKRNERLIPKLVEVYDYELDEVHDLVTSFHKGNNVYKLADGQAYILFNIIKTDFVYNISSDNLQVGIINKIRLNTNSQYLPNGELSGATLSMDIRYNDEIIPVYFDEDLNDYCFDIDLTDKLDNKTINVDLIVYESEFVNGGVYNHNLTCVYPHASSFNELKSLIVNGSKVIEIVDDISDVSENLTIPQNCYLMGNGHNFNLGNHTLFVKSITCKFVDLNFVNGNPVFVQGENSKIIIDNCVFENATISDEHKGSVLSTLNGSNIITNIKNSIILNCHHSIYHHGELNVKNIKARFNIFNEMIDTDYPSFLTMYSGTADISNSIFDINYETNDICLNNVDMRYANSLIGLGENTILNNTDSSKMNADNSLPFFNYPYNNKSHIFVKYYYPSIESCVYISPLKNKEDESVCHSLIGTDWIFKNNVQITRGDSNEENSYNKFNWEDY